VAEITTDVELSVPGRPAHILPVNDISVWVERYAVLEPILVTRFPKKAPEFFAFTATTVRAKCYYGESDGLFTTANSAERLWLAEI